MIPLMAFVRRSCAFAAALGGGMGDWSNDHFPWVGLLGYRSLLRLCRLRISVPRIQESCEVVRRLWSRE